MINYIIESLPRSGSTFLCDLLFRNNLLPGTKYNNLFEITLRGVIKKEKIHTLTEFQCFLDAFFNFERVQYHKNSLSGFKLIPSSILQMQNLISNASWKELIKLLIKEKKIIRIKREYSKLCYSYTHAYLTNAWRYDENRSLRKNFYTKDLFALDLAHKKIEQIKNWYDEEYLPYANNLCNEVYEIEFNELVSQPKEVIEKICIFLNVDTPKQYCLTSREKKMPKHDFPLLYKTYNNLSKSKTKLERLNTYLEKENLEN